MAARLRAFGPWIALGVALVGFPFAVESGYLLHVAILALIFVLLAVGLDITLGHCGQYSFAQGAFFGVGAYTAALAAIGWGVGLWVTLPLAVTAAALTGLLLGAPAVRLSGHFIAIVSIAFQVICYLVMGKWYAVTGGMSGLTGVPGFGTLSVFGFEPFAPNRLRDAYLIALVVTGAGLVLAHRLVASRLGREWRAIHDDELTARAVGVPSASRKLAAFAIGAGYAGAAGALLAHHLNTIHPAEFSLLTSATVIAMVIIGGRGTLVGPALGAVLLTVLPELLRLTDEWRLIAYGTAIIVFMVFLPKGLMGLLHRPREAPP